MTTFKQHHELTLTDLHGTIWQTVANQAARTAISVTAADIGKDVHQQDDDSVHKLVAVLPTVWKDITGAGGGASSSASDLVVSALKASVGTIAIGEVVYITGWDVGNGVITVELADASVTGTMPGYGIAKEAITDTVPGDLIVSGELTGQDTSSYSVGDALYVSETAGELTATKPTGTALIQKIGIVARSNITIGVIQIVGAGRSNDVPNIATDFVWMGNGAGVATATSRAGIDSDATSHASSDGSSHSDVVANTTHKDTASGNPHSVTKGEVGLGSADNTADVDKPVSTATQTALDGKADDPSWLEDVYTPTLGQVTFILSQAPAEPITALMKVNGVVAQETLDYTVSGSTLTWLNTSFSMETTDDVVIQYR